MDRSLYDSVRERFEAHQRELLKPVDVSLVKDLPIFAGLPEKKREQIIADRIAKYLSIVEREDGELLLEEGAYNDSGYYILEGAVEVIVPTGIDKPAALKAPAAVVRGGAHVRPADAKPPRPEAAGMIGRADSTSGTIILGAMPAETGGLGRKILEKGEIFGEISALSRYQTTASVRATGHVKLLRMQLRGLKNLASYSKDFKKFLDQRYRERALGRNLKQLQLFSKVPDDAIAALKDRVDLLSFEPGEVIAVEGSPADCLYLVRGGYVKVCIRQGAAELALTYLRKGDCAGQVSLFLDEPWPFTLQALESVEVVKLSREDFKELLRAQPELEAELWAQTVQTLKDRGAAVRNPAASQQIQMAMDSGLIHGESVLLIDLATCTRCDECVRGCADTHDGIPRFVREGERQGRWLVPTACYQCTDPVCMIDCPTGAITREFNSLVVTINSPDHASRPCIGCEGCAKRCPWGNIVMVPPDDAVKAGEGEKKEAEKKGRATKCDLCYTREEGPACVQMCPHGSAVRIPFRDLAAVNALMKRR
jgi:CRP-like cAMP-binding protein/Fe-S-cluster-containing hydrogenase component 2